MRLVSFREGVAPEIKRKKELNSLCFFDHFGPFFGQKWKGHRVSLGTIVCTSDHQWLGDRPWIAFSGKKYILLGALNWNHKRRNVSTNNWEHLYTQNSGDDNFKNLRSKMFKPQSYQAWCLPTKETILQKPSDSRIPLVFAYPFLRDLLYGNLCRSHQVAIAGHRFDVPEAQESTQWGGNWFPFHGGRYHIITQLATKKLVYKWYIYILPIGWLYGTDPTNKKGNQKQLLIYFNTASF